MNQERFLIEPHLTIAPTINWACPFPTSSVGSNGTILHQVKHRVGLPRRAAFTGTKRGVILDTLGQIEGTLAIFALSFNAAGAWRKIDGSHVEIHPFNLVRGAEALARFCSSLPLSLSPFNLFFSYLGVPFVVSAWQDGTPNVRIQKP